MSFSLCNLDKAKAKRNYISFLQTTRATRRKTSEWNSEALGLGKEMLLFVCVSI